MIGRWKISEINAIGMDFSQTWKSTDGLDDDPEVPEMQKTMAKTQYVFEDGGRYVSILLKDLAGDGDYEEYDEDPHDPYQIVLSHVFFAHGLDHVQGECGAGGEYKG